MKKTKLIAGLFITILPSCQNGSKQNKQNDLVVQNTTTHSEEAHAQPSNPVSLNNGEKWKANAETNEGIKNMAAFINEFTLHPRPEDNRSLKVNLETELNLIIQKCTMKGEAHEQLHRYLVPMNEMIKTLNSEDMEICRGAFDELKQHLADYENYFQ